MANATATISVNAFPNGKDNSMDHMQVYGTVAISASPATYPTGGLALAWTDPTIPTPFNPFYVEFQSQSASGYVYRWNASSGNFQIMADAGGAAGAAPLEELPNATAIPAGVSGDTIAFHAVFQRG